MPFLFGAYQLQNNEDGLIPADINDQGYLNLIKDDYIYFNMVQRIKEEKGEENL